MLHATSRAGARLVSMRWGLLTMCVVFAGGCNQTVDGGPSFGSGGSATAGPTAGTPTTTTNGASDSSGGAGSVGEDDTGGGATEASTTENGTSGGDAETTGGASDTTGATGESGESSSSTGESNSSGGGTPLDPDLDVPDEGESCSFPGNLNECPGIAVCRYYTAEEGRCESCDACGNLNDPCTEGTDCDILFSCFQGRCTNFCELGTFGCGPIEDCLDIGHPTHGVCDPFA